MGHGAGITFVTGLLCRLECFVESMDWRGCRQGAEHGRGTSPQSDWANDAAGGRGGEAVVAGVLRSALP